MNPSDVRGRAMHKTNRILLGKTISAMALMLAPTAAWGQDIAAAEALFNKGVADIKAGNYADACPAIAESQKLDPRPGTQFTLAECFARWGKTASAYVAFEDFLRTVRALPANQQGRYGDRVKVAEDKKVDLKSSVPELTIVLPSGAPSSVVVTRDGTEVNGPLFGLAVPVDPGPHKIIVEVEGKPPSEETVTLSAGEHRKVEVSVPGMVKANSDDPKSDDGGDGKPGMGRTIGMYTAFGVGAAGLVMGGITGGLALSDKHAADDQCPKFACTPEGFDAVAHGRTMARVSTAGFIIGGAGIAAGVILLLTRPKAEKTSVTADVSVSHSGFGLTVRGIWQ